MNAPPELSIIELSIAALLVLLNAGLSLALDLRLARPLLIAAARTVAQLSLVGVVLIALFEARSLGVTLLALLVMAGFAAWEVRARQKRRLAGPWGVAIGGGAAAASAVLVLSLALVAVIQPQPWHDPRFAVPLFGMILGNAMTGVSLGLDRLTSAAAAERAAIEAQLALGADRWTALAPQIREASRTAFTPIINAMAASGVVFLPGMMTGQILAGADPSAAVRYQILIMFLIAGATGAGALAAIWGAAARLTDDRHRLRLDRLAAAPLSSDGGTS